MGVEGRLLGEGCRYNDWVVGFVAGPGFVNLFVIFIFIFTYLTTI
jgi:hypothetical protein